MEPTPAYKFPRTEMKILLLTISWAFVSTVSCLLGDRTSLVIRNQDICSGPRTFSNYLSCLKSLQSIPDKVLGLLNAAMTKDSHPGIAKLAETFRFNSEGCIARYDTLREIHACVLRERKLSEYYIQTLECLSDEEYSRWIEHGPLFFDDFYDADILTDALLIEAESRCHKEFLHNNLAAHLRKIGLGQDNEQNAIHKLLSQHEDLLSKVLYPRNAPLPCRPSDLISTIVRFFNGKECNLQLIDLINAHFDWAVVPLGTLSKMLTEFKHFDEHRKFSVGGRYSAACNLDLRDIFQDLWRLQSFQEAVFQSLKELLFMGDELLPKLREAALESNLISLEHVFGIASQVKASDVRAFLETNHIDADIETLSEQLIFGPWSKYKLRLLELLDFIKEASYSLKDSPDELLASLFANQVEYYKGGTFEKLLLFISPQDGYLYTTIKAKYVQDRNLSLVDSMDQVWRNIPESEVRQLRHDFINMISLPIKWSLKNDSYEQVKVNVHKAFVSEIKRLGGNDFAAWDYLTPELFPNWFETLGTILHLVEEDPLMALTIASHVSIIAQSPEMTEITETALFRYQASKITGRDRVESALLRQMIPGGSGDRRFEVYLRSIGKLGILDLASKGDNANAWFDSIVKSDDYFPKEMWVLVAHGVRHELGVHIPDLEAKLNAIESGGYQAIRQLFRARREIQLKGSMPVRLSKSSK